MQKLPAGVSAGGEFVFGTMDYDDDLSLDMPPGFSRITDYLIVDLAVKIRLSSLSEQLTRCMPLALLLATPLVFAATMGGNVVAHFNLADSNAKKACWMAAGLGEPIRFNVPAHFDESVGYDVLNMEGRDLRQSDRNATSHVLCLYERSSGLAFISSPDTPGAGYTSASSTGSHILPLGNGAAVVVAEESAEPSASGSYSVRLYSNLSSGILVAGIVHPRAGRLLQAELKDMDGDHSPEVVVTIQSLGAGREAFTSTDVYKLYGTERIEFSPRLSFRTP